MRKVLLVAAALVLSACSTVDFEAPKTASYADVDTSSTTFAQRLSSIREERHPESGFYSLSTGVDALSARLLLIERAERTLDIQY